MADWGLVGGALNKIEGGVGKEDDAVFCLTIGVRYRSMIAYDDDLMNQMQTMKQPYSLDSMRTDPLFAPPRNTTQNRQPYKNTFARAHCCGYPTRERHGGGVGAANAERGVGGGG